MNVNVCEGEIVVLVNIVHSVLNIIQYAVPIILIVLGTIDLFKAMTKGDEKEQAKHRDIFIKRLVYALVIFLIPFIIKLAFGVAASITNNTPAGQDITNAKEGGFFKCWN